MVIIETFLFSSVCGGGVQMKWICIYDEFYDFSRLFAKNCKKSSSFWEKGGKSIARTEEKEHLG